MGMNFIIATIYQYASQHNVNINLNFDIESTIPTVLIKMSRPNPNKDQPLKGFMKNADKTVMRQFLINDAFTALNTTEVFNQVLDRMIEALEKLEQEGETTDEN